MDPVQFALRDKSINDIFSLSGSGDFSAWGWILLALIIVVLFLVIRKLIKRKKHNKSNEK